MCKDDKKTSWYSGTLVSGDSFVEYSPLMRCTKKLCTTCPNPTVDGKGGQFTPSKGHDGCSKFECGEFTRMIRGPKNYGSLKLVCSKGETDGSATWNNNAFLTNRNVVCLKLCTGYTKLDMTCDTGDTHCAQMVLNDDKAVSCPSGLNKYYKNDQGKWNMLSSKLECNKLDGLWKSDTITLKAQQKAVCHHGCVIPRYYVDSLCGDKNECHEPTPQEPNCIDDHGLQVLSQGIWRDATKFYCHDERFMFLAPLSTDLQLVTENVRCIRKKIEDFSVLTVPCDDNSEECTKPSDCTNLSCESIEGSALQLKISNEWKIFKSARCNSDQFVVTETKNSVDVERIEPNVEEIRCIRKKCSLCSNPCPACTGGYSAPATGNDCAKFTCGANSRTVFYTSTTSIVNNKPENVDLICKSSDGALSTWSFGGNEQLAFKVGCEKSCTKISRFDSICDQNDKHCEQIAPNDDNQITCRDTKKIFFTGSTGSALAQTSSLQCDPTSGKWEDGNSGLISDMKNAVCHYGIEEIDPYYDRLSCLTNDDECRKPDKIGANPCQPEFGLQVDFGANQNPAGWNKATEIFTDNNRFVIAVGQPTPFVHGYRCIHKKIDKFFHGDRGCDTETDCKKPENCDKLTCPEFYALQHTTEATPSGQNWIDLPAGNELRCNSDKFTDKNNNEVTLTGVRCARKKCTLCKNPCSVKDQCFSESHTGFTGPTKWDDCVKFKCGVATRTDVILPDGVKTPFDNADLTCTNDGILWSLTGFAQPVTFAECRMSCRLKQPLESKCVATGKDKHCEEWAPDEDVPHACSKSMFYVSKTSNNLVEISTLSCDKATGSWKAMKKGATQEQDVPTDTVEVNCHYGCEASKYYDDSGCGAEHDCSMPTKSGDNVVCSSGFGLQVDFEKQINDQTHDWRDADVTCENHKFEVKEKDPAGIASQTASQHFPYSLRCIRKKLSKFYEQNSMCKPDEDCKMPVNCAALTCEEANKFSLQVKYPNADWQIATTARCDSDKFTIDSVQDQPEGIKCVRKRCSVCEDPCPNCPEEFGKTFTESTKWDECAKFSCDNDATTVFNPMSKIATEKSSHQNAKLVCSEVRSGEVFWKVNNGPTVGTKSGIACEVSCAKKNPLISDCAGFNEETCGPLTASDDGNNRDKCNIFLYVALKEGSKSWSTAIKLKSLVCNKTDGTWIGVRDDDYKQLTIPADSKINCNQGHCDFDTIFPSCPNQEKDPKSVCVTTNPNGTRYTCMQHEDKEITMWYRMGHKERWQKLDETELACKGGVIKSANGEEKGYDFQGNCRKPITKTAKQERPFSQTATGMILIVIGIFAGIGLIIFIVLWKIEKKRWLHSDIIKKILSMREDRRDPRRRARKKYKKYFGHSYRPRSRRSKQKSSDSKSAPPSSNNAPTPRSKSSEPLPSSKSAPPSSANSPTELSAKAPRSESAKQLAPSSNMPTSEDIETKSIAEVTPKSTDV